MLHFRENSQEISRTFPGMFPVIYRTFPGKFPGNFRNIYWTFTGNLPEMSRGISRTFPGNVRESSRNFSGRPEGCEKGPAGREEAVTPNFIWIGLQCAELWPKANDNEALTSTLTWKYSLFCSVFLQHVGCKHSVFLTFRLVLCGLGRSGTPVRSLSTYFRGNWPWGQRAITQKKQSQRVKQ